MSEIIPFGKYKGKPLEAMMQDKPYVEWLMAQNWFQTNNLYTIVVNNFGEASETPEHNAMQVLFLDENIKNKLINKLDKEDVWNYYNFDLRALKEDIENLEKHIKGSPTHYLNKSLKEHLSKLEIHEKKIGKIESGTRFEAADVDLKIHGTIYLGITRHHFEHNIELKPQVGDDYPAVLRGMNRKRCNVLILKQYTGTGATREQFVKIFESSRIKVLFLEDII